LVPPHVRRSELIDLSLIVSQIQCPPVQAIPDVS
jgi:hypothetical protein